MYCFKNMKNIKKKFLLTPSGSSNGQVVKWLINRNKMYNLFLVCWSIFLLFIIYFISPSLINYFSIVLTLIIILCLNATYFLYVISIALFIGNRRLDIANKYFIKNSFRINIFFSAIILILFSMVLIIPKFN